MGEPFGVRDQPDEQSLLSNPNLCTTEQPREVSSSSSSIHDARSCALEMGRGGEIR